MVEVDGITKKYGSKTVLDHVSFSIREGEIVGLLGLNGAGKSTMMNILSGYIRATSGTVKIAGWDISEDAAKVRGIIGYLPEIPPLYTDMTVGEYLHFVWNLYKKSGNEKHRTQQVLELTSLDQVHGRLIRNLSKGYRQRIGIAQAILPEPKLLILDEPTVGLDPNQVVEMRNLIQEVSKNMTVLMSSHILSEVQIECSRVLVLNTGRLIADDTPQHLSDLTHSKRHAAIRVRGSREVAEMALGSIEGLINLEYIGQKEEDSAEFALEGADGRDIREDIFQALSLAGLPLLYTYGGEMSLEDVFLNLVEADRKGGNR